MTLHREPDAFPQTCKSGKTYLAGTQWSGCLGGLDLLIVCLSGHPPLVHRAWGEAAASDQQMLKKIFYKLVFEASSTSQCHYFVLGPTVLTPLHIWGSCYTTKSWCFCGKLLKFSLQLFKPWILSLSSSLRTSNSVPSSPWQPQI